MPIVTCIQTLTKKEIDHREFQKILFSIQEAILFNVYTYMVGCKKVNVL